VPPGLCPGGTVLSAAPSGLRWGTSGLARDGR
jgi:hypothetical protein